MWNRKRYAPLKARLVSIEREGKVHSGHYTVHGPLVRVTSIELGTKSGRLGGGTPADIATTLLRNLLDAQRSGGRKRTAMQRSTDQ